MDPPVTIVRNKQTSRPSPSTTSAAMADKLKQSVSLSVVEFSNCPANILKYVRRWPWGRGGLYPKPPLLFTGKHHEDNIFISKFLFESQSCIEDGEKSLVFFIFALASRTASQALRLKPAGLYSNCVSGSYVTNTTGPVVRRLVAWSAVMHWCQIAETSDWQPQCVAGCVDQKAELYSTSGAGQKYVKHRQRIRQMTVAAVPQMVSPAASNLVRTQPSDLREDEKFCAVRTTATASGSLARDRTGVGEVWCLIYLETDATGLHDDVSAPRTALTTLFQSC